MDIKILSEFKKKLLAVRDSLLAQISGLRKHVDMGDDIDSFEEEADDATEMVANAGMVEDLKRQEHRVVDALGKIEKGNYGLCEKCSKNIELPLLQVDPESRYCKACKEAMRS
jgi:RNA polymerase-binding transcription factor DksA